jgi:hypothetical protein
MLAEVVDAVVQTDRTGVGTRLRLRGVHDAALGACQDEFDVSVARDDLRDAATCPSCGTLRGQRWRSTYAEW